MGAEMVLPLHVRLLHRLPVMAAGALAMLAAAVYAFQLTYNTTASLPVGVYRVRALIRNPRVGEVVGFCLEGEMARVALARGYVHRQGWSRGCTGSSARPVRR